MIALRALWSYWNDKKFSYLEHLNRQNIKTFIDSLSLSHKSDFLSPTRLHVSGLEPYQENFEAFEELFKSLKTQNTWTRDSVTRERDRVPLIAIDGCPGMGKSAFLDRISFIVRAFQLGDFAASSYLNFQHSYQSLQDIDWLKTTLVVSISYDNTSCSPLRYS